MPIPDNRLLPPAESLEEVYLLIMMADYEHLMNELQFVGLLVEYDTSDGATPLPNKTEKKLTSLRLKRFFGVEINRKQPPNDLFDDKNSICHGSYSDAEFDQMKEVAERNTGFLQSYDITLGYLESMAVTLRRSRLHGHNQFFSF